MSALINAKGGFAAAESYAWHRYLLTSKGDVYDPRVVGPHPARRSTSARPTISTSSMRGAR